MTRRIFCALFVLFLSIGVSIASAERAEKLELSLFLGMKDGSESSDGVTVRFTIEEGEDKDIKETVIFEEHWADQQWSDQFVVPLNEWGGRKITLKMTTDPGIARNTGWDWILIGDAKITADDDAVFNFGQAISAGLQTLSLLLDGEDEEQAGLAFGANCQLDGGAVGGEVKTKAFMQHPPWDGRVGNTIARYEIELPFAVGAQAVEAGGKVAATWGHLKTY